MNTVAHTVAVSTIYDKLFFYSALKQELAAKKGGRGKKEVTAADFSASFKQVRRWASDKGCMPDHIRMATTRRLVLRYSPENRSRWRPWPLLPLDVGSAWFYEVPHNGFCCNEA